MNQLGQQSLLGVEQPSTTETISALLAARAATAGAGNRRALFASMDKLLTRASLPVAPEALPASSLISRRESVRLARLRLRNWKAFERADLTLPLNTPQRPLIVIGGANGFGKSSLLEAFAFGLFGRRALSEIGFVMSVIGSLGAQRRAYRTLLQRSLHRSNRAREEGMCSVALDFETAIGPVAVERKWYFDETGQLLEEEEELLVRIGDDRELLETPAGVSAAEWYQEELERLLMPAALAPFFILDGEQVERWAERRLSDQVRGAVARLLGLDQLRGLVDDLRGYARDRDRAATSDAASRLAALQPEIDQLERELETEAFLLRRLDEQLSETKAQRDVILSRLANASKSSHADLQELLEAQHRQAGDAKRLERELIGAIAEEGPLLLAGARLLTRVAEALDEEAGEDLVQLDRGALDDLWERFVRIDPPLETGLVESLRTRFEAACDHDREGATSRTHGHLTPASRRAVGTRVRDARERGAKRIAAILEELSHVRGALEAMRRSQGDMERRAAERIEAQSELARLTALIEAGEGERGARRRQVETLDQALGPKREELSRRTALLREAEPRARNVAVARALAVSIEEHMEEIAAGQHQRFADAVTECFRKLSHKDQIARIDLSADGEVSLFDAGGRDISDYPLSAGESQLFAVALIAAVDRIAGDRLPLIVDTPLGRLDTRHRDAVLELLGSRGAQTILLTQPEELSPRHLAMIEPVVGGAVRLEHFLDAVSGVGVSMFLKGIDYQSARADSCLEPVDMRP